MCPEDQSGETLLFCMVSWKHAQHSHTKNEPENLQVVSHLIILLHKTIRIQVDHQYGHQIHTVLCITRGIVFFLRVPLVVFYSHWVISVVKVFHLIFRLKCAIKKTILMVQ